MKTRVRLSTKTIIAPLRNLIITVIINPQIVTIGVREMELTYRNENGYLIPNLIRREKPETTLGKYAYLREKYLKEHRRLLYVNLLTTDKLTEHLWDIEQTALEMVETITKNMAASEDVTEELKAKDMMKWVGLMNNIRSSAEETVLNDLIYA